MEDSLQIVHALAVSVITYALAAVEDVAERIRLETVRLCAVKSVAETAAT